MELQQESFKTGVLSATTSRNLSSSSSAFVSASQSPFFSPRSPKSNGSEQAQVLADQNPASALALCSEKLDTRHNSARQAVIFSNALFEASDVSPIPCSTPNFEYTQQGIKKFDQLSPSNSIYSGSSSSNCEQENTGKCNLGPREKQRRRVKPQKKLSFARGSALLSSTRRPRGCDVYIGYHGRKPALLRFVNWLRAELECQGISCFAADRAHCRNARSHDTVERAMNESSYGVVILTKKSFGNPYSIEEISSFLGRKNLVPVFFDLSSNDCIPRDIVEKRGELWERHGGELWMLYGGLEKEWKDAVDGIMRMDDWKLEAHDGNWRDCILNAVILLATRLRRRSAVDRVNRWREKVEKEEFPFPRNEEFVGRKKELSELELMLFGNVSGDGEREYFELKPRYRQKSLAFHRDENTTVEESTKDRQSESSSKGKDPVIWKESEKEIEMQRLGSPQRQFHSQKSGRHVRKKRSLKPVYGRGIACVSGDSGIGKTELVLEYAYRFHQRYKMVLWIGGETRYIRQNYLNLRSFLDVDVGIENHSLEKGKPKNFEKQEDEAVGRVRKELMRDIPFLVVIDNLESEKDWWDRKLIMDLLPRFGGETHFIITSRLPRVMNLEPMKLSFLSGMEAIALMRGSSRDYPISETDALRTIEDKLCRLTLGLGVVGAILSELPITPSRLLDTVNRVPLRELIFNDKEALALKRNTFLMQLLEVCFSIFDHADGPKSLATRMVKVSGWFAPGPVPVRLLSLAAHRITDQRHRSRFWKKCLHAMSCKFLTSHMKKPETEASSMLVRFGIARSSNKPGCVQFHDLIKLYSRKRGTTKVAHAMVQAICLQGSITHHPDHLWAACFLLFGFGSDPTVVELKPSELLLFVKRVVLPLAIHTFITFSRCNAALELLRLCTEALELAAESMLSRSEKWMDRSLCCARPIQSNKKHTYLWQELALMKATLLETRTKLLLRGGQYDIGDDLIRKAIFIRSSICGEQHPDTVSARETLSKLTRLLTNVQFR